MHQRHVDSRQRAGQHGGRVFGGLRLQQVGFLDQRTDPVRLPPFADGGVDSRDDFVAPRLRQDHRGDRCPPGRQLVYDGNVEVGVGRHRQRPRDRRRRHDQLVREAPLVHALLAQGQALVHPEAVLLVDDGQRQAAEAHALLEQGVRPDDHRHPSGRDRAERALARLAREPAGQQPDVEAQRLQPAIEILPVLLGEQLGRGHQRRLAAGLDRAQGGQRGDHRLAAAHVALHEPQHRVGPSEIRAHFRQHAPLRAGQRERQRPQQPVLERAGSRQGPGRVAPHFAAQQPQRQLVGEQFLEGQPALRRVLAGGEQVERRVGRRAVHVFQRSVQRRQAEVLQQLRRKPVAHARVGHLPEGQCGQHPQAALLHALGRRIDGRQHVLDGLGVARVGAPVLRVDDLQADRTPAHLAEALQARTPLQLLLLHAREMEETKREEAGAVGEAHE